MTTARIIDLFQDQYDRQAWKNFLLDIIGEQYFQPLSEPVEEKRSDSISRISKKITRYANLETSDGKTLPIFEVILQDNVVIERNRVTVNELIRNLIRSKGREGALVTFAYSKEQSKKEWRFSFIAHEESLFFEENDLVKTNPKRYTYVFGTPETHRTAIHRFELLKRSEKSIHDLMEAFAVEKLSKAFFNQYREHYGRFIAYLTGKDKNDKPVGEAAIYLRTIFNGDDKKARDFVKKMLGRIVFLYFIQRKGWLGVPLNGKWGEGDPNFMAEFFKASGGDENFYPLFLDRLFFETLSTKRPNDEIELIEGERYRIPYLNGGLFERDDSLPSNEIITFPPELFQDLFDFLGAYNFTIYESSPDEHTVAVDPEMLGHIFENLLEDNKDKGAFYTPKAIVHYMCQESLIEYLLTRLNNEVERAQLEGFIKHKHANDTIIQFAERIDQLLDAVKICDPAIGSGAFPMGLLLEIYNAKLLLFDHVKNKKFHPKDLESGNYHYQIKENIIQNSIYGVDIEAGAVDIARLRFWLSLVVDENEPKPLPNLDFKIVVGDSLLPKFEDEVIEIDWTKKISAGNTQVYVDNIQRLLKEIVERQKDYFHPRGDKNELKKEIHSRKIDLLINQLSLNKAVFAAKHVEGGNLDLFIKEKTKNQIEAEEKLSDYDYLIKRLSRLKNLDKKFWHFDWKLDFPDVMNPQVADGDGFDIVIANPPYINANDLKKKLGKESYKLLKSKFSTARGACDIYIYFFEKGLEILKKNTGILCFISPNKYLSVSYGKALRNFLFSNATMLTISDYSSIRVFESASIYPIVSVFRKGRVNSLSNQLNIKVGKCNVESFALDIKYIRYNKLQILNDLIWGFLLNNKLRITEKVINQSLRLTSAGKINATSTASEADKYHSLINEQSIGVKIVNTGTIDRYETLWGRREMVDKGERYHYPYLNINSEIISENRRILYNSPKIIFAKIALISEGFLDYSGEYASINTNCIYDFSPKFDMFYVAAWVNSKLFQYIFECFFEGVKMSGGYMSYSAPNLSCMYIKEIDRKKQIPFISLVKKILRLKEGGKDTSNEEKEIDLYFYKLFELNFDEAKTIDPSINISEEEYTNYSI